MTIPFEKLGPGQQGRLVYQVIGEDGPVFNPQKIRYLSPDEAPFETAVPDLGVALSGVNALASFGGLSVSVATLASVQRLHEKADQILSGVTSIDRKTQQILEKVSRIDMKVSESSLRESLKAVFRRAFVGDTIDLSRLKSLKGDLDSFLDSIDGGMFNLGVRLSSDVREMVQTLWSVLAQVRKFVARAHNVRVQGDPAEVAMFHPIEDYIRVSNAASQAAMITAIVETLDKTEVALLESLNSRFTFFNDDDAAAVSELLGEQNTGPLIELFGAFSPMAFGLAVADLDAATAVPVGDRERYFLDLAEAWLTRTDAGLVYRAFVEIRGLEDGYADEFWPHLKAIEHSKSGEIIGVWDEASLAGLSPRAVDQEVSKPKENTTQRAGGMKARLTR